MKHTFAQVFRSGKFVVGFSIFVAILLVVILYPLLVPYPPLEIIAQGTFFQLIRALRLAPVTTCEEISIKANRIIIIFFGLLIHINDL